MPSIKNIREKTTEMFKTKWTPDKLHVPGWVLNVFLWLLSFEALWYALDLIFLIVSPIAPIMAFATVAIPLPVWGILLLIAVLVLISGLLSKRSILITIGALLCLTVWGGLAIGLLIGFIALGTGGGFFAATLVSALMHWLVFHVQLRNISKNGA